MANRTLRPIQSKVGSVSATNDNGGGGLGVDPMHQFEIKSLISINLGGIDASFTNSAAWMVAAAGCIVALTVFAMNGRAMVPGRWQSMAELSYEFVANMVRDNVGNAGQAYFPFIFTLFMFVLFSNLLGMIPFSFTTTSHIIVTFALAMFIFLGVTLIGFVKHGLHFFSFFAPKGLPIALLPLIIVIEVISYLSRPISLSVRLFANMMVGHTMMKVVAGFVVGFIGAGGIFAAFATLPLAFMVAFTGLEILVACLQAYVFAILTCIYLNDALHLH